MDTTKKTGTFQGKPNTLGGGGRFAQMQAKGASPALAAFIGQKIYGKKKMTKMATKAKKKVTPKSPMQPTPPKGIAVGNPMAVK